MATTNRFTQLGLAAARMAYEDAGLAQGPEVSRVSVCFGSSTAAAPVTKQIAPSSS